MTAASPFAMATRCLKVLLAVFIIRCLPVLAVLTTGYYKEACPNLEQIVKQGVIQATEAQTRNAASLLRLNFHDCFVNGCDGSVLLDDTPEFKGEKTARQNINSLRAFEWVDYIKAQVEAECPALVSCADLLCLIARDAAYISNGPSWDVRLGRRDSTYASKRDAERFLPEATDDIDELKQTFRRVGLSSWDLATLSGAHTIGKASCVNVVSSLQLYNNRRGESSIDAEFLETLKANCWPDGNMSTMVSLDVQTPTQFDNAYYENVVALKVALKSDAELLAADDTRTLVQRYATEEPYFVSAFADSMISMQSLKPLEYPQGEIRRYCRYINSDV